MKKLSGRAPLMKMKNSLQNLLGCINLTAIVSMKRPRRTPPGLNLTIAPKISWDAHTISVLFNVETKKRAYPVFQPGSSPNNSTQCIIPRTFVIAY